MNAAKTMSKRHHKMIRRTLLISAAAISMAACSDTDETDTAGAADVAVEQEQPGVAASDIPENAGGDMTPDSVDIVEAASANDNLSTFLEAAMAADLAETLAETQNVTVFAPINEAFESVEGIDGLLQDQEALAALLQRHAVGSVYLSGDIPEGETELETLSGETIVVTNNGGQVSVALPSGVSAMVVEADIEADNGVVHAINTVLAD